MRRQVTITQLDVGWQVNVSELEDADGGNAMVKSVARHACTSPFEVLRLVSQACGLSADALLVTVMPGCTTCGESFGKIHNVSKHTDSLDWSAT